MRPLDALALAGLVLFAGGALATVLLPGDAPAAICAAGLAVLAVVGGRDGR